MKRQGFVVTILVAFGLNALLIGITLARQDEIHVPDGSGWGLILTLALGVAAAVLALVARRPSRH